MSGESLRVGIIGAGLMGTACAVRLTRAGHEVWAYDIDRAKIAAVAELGAREAESIAEIAVHCPILVLCVFNTDQVEQVIEGEGGVAQALVGKGVERLVVCTSTCDPDRLATLAARIAARGVQFLEAPISGTSAQVAAGHGVGLVGGAVGLIAGAAAVLDAICPRRHDLGAVGNGSRTKLAINLILGLNRAALAEGLVFAERLGLDPVAFLAVAQSSAAYSQIMDVKGPAMAERAFERAVQSRVEQSLKDFKLIAGQANAKGLALPFASVYVALLENCVQHGEGQWDNGAILEAIRRSGPSPRRETA